MAFLWSACNSGSDQAVGKDTISSQGPVDNVNGNMPDTGNSLSPSVQGKDTSGANDTTAKKRRKAGP